jgi:hypothetical protein
MVRLGGREHAIKEYGCQVVRAASWLGLQLEPGRLGFGEAVPRACKHSRITSSLHHTARETMVQGALRVEVDGAAKRGNVRGLWTAKVEGLGVASFGAQSERRWGKLCCPLMETLEETGGYICLVLA